LHGDTPERHRAAARTFPQLPVLHGSNTRRRQAQYARHYDVPMRDCTVELDGRRVIEDGASSMPE